MFNTNIRSFRSSTLLITTTLLCFASLATASPASVAPIPGGGTAFEGPGHACIVVRHAGARHAGHVAWGVEISRDHYLFGAVEGPSSNGSAGWFKAGSWGDMLAAFQKASLRPGRAGEPYDAIRCVPVSRPNTARAWTIARSMADRSRHYNLLNLNCLHATYAVLHDYGTANLPSPHGFFRLPNLYYNRFDGRHEWILRR
jgi:hypothetical protein